MLSCNQWNSDVDTDLDDAKTLTFDFLILNSIGIACMHIYGSEYKVTNCHELLGFIVRLIS